MLPPVAGQRLEFATAAPQAKKLTLRRLLNSSACIHLRRRWRVEVMTIGA
jgi:hypothetical protein